MKKSVLVMDIFSIISQYVKYASGITYVNSSDSQIIDEFQNYDGKSILLKNVNWAPTKFILLLMISKNRNSILCRINW